MYVYIDGERWGGNACPPLTELHGELADPIDGTVYGHFLTDDQVIVVRRAFVNRYGTQHPWGDVQA